MRQSREQELYMREVRLRNREDIEALTGFYKSRMPRADRYWADDGRSQAMSTELT